MANNLQNSVLCVYHKFLIFRLDKNTVFRIVQKHNNHKKIMSFLGI